MAIIEQGKKRRRRATESAGRDDRFQDRRDPPAILRDRCDEAIRILESDLSPGRGLQRRGADQRRRLSPACAGTTPLHVAAWKHNPEMVAWLLDRGRPSTHAGRRTARRRSTMPRSSPAGRRTVATSAFLENSHIEPARFHETVRLLRAKGAELTPRAAVAIGDARPCLQMHREGRLKNEIHSCRGGLLVHCGSSQSHRHGVAAAGPGIRSRRASRSTRTATRVWGMPLWFASMCGRHEIAELLLARGADVNAIVHACGDALALCRRTGDEKMKALLLKHGARTHRRTRRRLQGPRNREGDSGRDDSGAQPERRRTDAHGPGRADAVGRGRLRPGNRAHVPAAHDATSPTIRGGTTSSCTPPCRRASS